MAIYHLHSFLHWGYNFGHKLDDKSRKQRKVLKLLAMVRRRDMSHQEEHKKRGKFRILLDKKWYLKDLHEFPHAFNQCYSFIYCLDSQLEPIDQSRIDNAFFDYPWKGGYSYVNIYTVLANQIPLIHRPEIKSISYSSPGWLDLILNVDVAIQVAKSVAILSGASVAAAKAYSNIQKTLLDLKKARAQAELDNIRIVHQERKVINEMCKDFSKFLGFKSVEELHKHTQDPEVSLKLLAAHYRRTEVLVQYSQEKKAVMPNKAE